jgi:hypothetical protein
VKPRQRDTEGVDTQQRTAVRLVQKLACPLRNLLRVDRRGERLGGVASAEIAHEVVVEPAAA